MKLIEANLEKIRSLCVRYKVKSLYVFGSILTPRFSRESDVDFLVNFKKNEIPMEEFADYFFDFNDSLENLLLRKVDLVCDDAIKNPVFRREVDNNKFLIYG